MTISRYNKSTYCYNQSTCRHYNKFTFGHNIVDLSLQVDLLSQQTLIAYAIVVTTSPYVATRSRHVVTTSRIIAKASRHIVTTSRHVGTTSRHVGTTSRHVVTTISRHFVTASLIIATVSRHFVTASLYIIRNLLIKSSRQQWLSSPSLT